MGRKKRVTPMVRFSLELRDDQAARLDALADRTGEIRSAWIRRFIDEGLEREDRKRNKDK